MSTPLLRLQKISKYYTGEQFVVLGLNNVSLSLSRGEFVAISGESGSGKSTLTHILAGVLPYEAGELFFNGKPTSHYDGSDWERYRCENISLISQNYGILPGATVWSNVVSALLLTGMGRAEAALEAEKILKKVELWQMRKRRAAKLSSGQKQRLSVARALAKPAPILLADEPTGNLDPENSAKVIALLAEAAKDRLVILITHEFSEAEALATRHIVLQDGSVIMDAPLREPYQPDEPIESKPARPEKKRLGGYVASLQMRARPIWSLIMMIFFSLTALAVFVFLGTFLTNLDDNSTRIYDNSAFRNGDMNRLVVQRLDGSNFSDDDFAVLAYVPYISHLERYGYVADVNYSYREDVDYYWSYTREGDEMSGTLHAAKTLKFYNTDLFMKTVPESENDFLTAGRMPEGFYEVVSGDPALLGKTLTVYLRDKNQWGLYAYIALEVEVVGTTDCGEHLYFSEDVGRMICGATQMTVWANDNFFAGGIAYFAPSADLFDTQMLLNENKLIRIGQDSSNLISRDARTGDKIFLTASAAHDSTLLNYVLVSETMFRRIVPQKYGNQVSLSVENYAYVDRVIEVLQQMGYGVISPYRSGSQTVDETLAAERLSTLRLCLIVLVAVLLLQVVVLRALFGTQTENYRLLSNIGLSCREAKLSILWQFLLFTALGQIVGLAGIYVGNSMGIERIVSLVRYLPAEKAVILFLTHLAAALIAAWWVMRTLRRNVYPFGQQKTDLNWKELEEAEAK